MVAYTAFLFLIFVIFYFSKSPDRVQINDVDLYTLYEEVIDGTCYDSDKGREFIPDESETGMSSEDDDIVETERY